MRASTEWQIAGSAAELYQSILTPTILGPFARALVECADLQAGEQIVDVGCGTGAAARYAAELVGGTGYVIAVDINEDMLEVARSLPPVIGAAIDWRVANVGQLSLPDRSTDVVLCAQVLQFLPNKEMALSEMVRITKPGGRMAMSVWCDISDNPYFNVLVGAMSKYVGMETAVGLQSAFTFTNIGEIYSLFVKAGLVQIEMQVARLDLPLPPLREFVPRHIGATPMTVGFSRASEAVQQMVIEAVVDALSSYGTSGCVSVPFCSHMIIGRKRG